MERERREGKREGGGGREERRKRGREKEGEKKKEEGTEVEYPLIRACSSSTALTAVGLHTQYAHIGRLAIPHIS